MEDKKQGNLTEGPILKVLMKLAMPIMASAFLMTAYNITDMAFIGMLGSKAVAGVGVGGMFIWLSQGFSNLARMGGQVHVGQCLGRGDREGAKAYILATMQLGGVLGFIFGGICFFFETKLVERGEGDFGAGEESGAHQEQHKQNVLHLSALLSAAAGLRLHRFRPECRRPALPAGLPS